MTVEIIKYCLAKPIPKLRKTTRSYICKFTTLVDIPLIKRSLAALHLQMQHEGSIKLRTLLKILPKVLIFPWRTDINNFNLPQQGKRLNSSNFQAFQCKTSV